MSRDKTIKFLRTTKANLETQKTGSNLLVGEPYLITDEGRIAIGTANNAYSEMAKKSEAGGKLIKGSLFSAYTTSTSYVDVSGTVISVEANKKYRFTTSFLFSVYFNLSTNEYGFAYTTLVIPSGASVVFNQIGKYNSQSVPFFSNPTTVFEYELNAEENSYSLVLHINGIITTGGSSGNVKIQLKDVRGLGADLSSGFISLIEVE